MVAPARPRTLTATYKPTKALVRIGTSQRALEIKVDGDKVTRFRGDVKVGSRIRLEAPRVQKHDGDRYEFVRWSDGGARAHVVVVRAQRLA